MYVWGKGENEVGEGGGGGKKFCILFDVFIMDYFIWLRNDIGVNC